MAAKKTLQFVSDSWVNFLTRVGMRGDKRTAARMQFQRLPYPELLLLYRGDRYAARIVNTPANAMVRKWLKVRVQDDADLGKALDKRLEELRAQAKFKLALQQMRMSGGAGIFLGVNDGVKNLEEPLNEKNIKSVDFLVNFNLQELHATDYYSDPFDGSGNFGLPKVYNLQPRILHDSTATVPVRGLVRVHESRILRFSGPNLDRYHLSENFGFGDSILQTVWELTRDYGQTWSGFFAMLQGYAQDVYKLNGLKEAIAADGEGLVDKRLELMAAQRAILRGVFLDNGSGAEQPEAFETKTTSLAGMPDMAAQMSLQLASAAEMPVSLLMGQAPAGLNATGASDIRFFYDAMNEKQIDDVQPQAEKLVRVLMLDKSGPAEGAEPEGWHIHFPPLWQLDDQQEADRRQKVAAADAIYLANGVVSADEVANSRYGGDEFSADTHLDGTARKTMKEAMQQEQDALDLEQKTAMAAAKAPKVAPGGKAGAQVAAPSKGKGK